MKNSGRLNVLVSLLATILIFGVSCILSKMFTGIWSYLVVFVAGAVTLNVVSFFEKKLGLDNEEVKI